mgnify:CR=1 FL=1|jgi:hypothetical protein
MVNVPILVGGGLLVVGLVVASGFAFDAFAKGDDKKEKMVEMFGMPPSPPPPSPHAPVGRRVLFKKANEEKEFKLSQKEETTLVSELAKKRMAKR